MADTAWPHGRPRGRGHAAAGGSARKVRSGSVQRVYVDKEPVWIDQIKGIEKTFVKVDRSFFGDVAETWSAKWSEKSTALEGLCAVAAATAE